MIRWGGTTTASLTGKFEKGFYAGNRAGSTDLKLYKNGVVAATNSASPSSMTKVSQNIYVLAWRTTAEVAPCPTKCAFYSIGDTMTDAEHAALYLAVQRLQANIARAVVS